MLTKDNKDKICQKIIEKITTNRISTTEIADCLGKKGWLQDICPLNKQHFIVGKVFLAYAFNQGNWELHQQLEKVKSNEVVLIETYNCQKRAVFGALVSKYLLLYKRAAGLVVNGYMRDANRLYKENYPIWCQGVTPIGCFNRKNEKKLDKEILKLWKKKYDGAIAVCDDGGVIIIPPEAISYDFLKKLSFIELQEDIWFHCIDTKKWSTYETVCLKKYLNTELLPKELKEKFERFIKKLDERQIKKDD